MSKPALICDTCRAQFETVTQLEAHVESGHQTSNTDLRFRISARLSKYAAHVAKHGTGYFEHQDADMAALNDIMQLIESSQAAAYKQGVTDCNTWDTWKLHANNIDTDKLDQELKNKIAAAVQAARVETVNKAIEMARRADDFVGDVKVVRVTHLAQLQGGKSDE